MTELLGQTFFQHALIAGTLVAATCSYVGVYVLLKRIAFLAIALAQIASAGVALALLVGLNPLATALVASLAGAVLFSQVRWRDRVPIEGVLATGYILASALGTLFIAKNPVGEARALRVLFGNILSVPDGELVALAAVALVVLAIHLRFRKEFLFVSFDFETAAAHGVKARLFDLLLYLTLGAAIAFAIRSTGILVTFALLVVPALGARLVSSGMDAMFTAAVAIGALSVPAGLALAFAFDLPTGAALSLTVGLLVAAAVAARALARAGRRGAAASAALALAALLAGPASAAAPGEQPAGPDGGAPAAPSRAALPPYLSLLPEMRIEGNFIGNYTFGDARRLARELGEEVPGDGGDVFVRRNRFNVRSLELGLRSTVDPFAKFEGFFEAQQDFDGDLRVSLEEVFLTFTALPGHPDLIVGKFRTHFGEFNDGDPEEFPEVDPPKVILNVFGREGEGWVDTGVAITRNIGISDAYAIQPWFGIFNGDNGTAFHGGGAGVARKPAWFVRVEHFLEIGQSTGLEVAFGYAEGSRGEAADLRSQIANAHAQFSYKPATRALYYGFDVLTEAFVTRFEREVEDATTGLTNRDAAWRYGVYSLAEVRLSRDWAVGGRFDYSQLPAPSAEEPPHAYELSGALIVSYRPSRFLTLRAQYAHTERNFASDSDELFLQALFVVGFDRPGPF